MCAAAARGEVVHVAAAISLKDALTEIGKAYRHDRQIDVELSFGSSGQMLAQIENGAPIDDFISAANEQVDAVVKAGLADAQTRRIIAANELVLVTPRDSSLGLKSFKDLAAPAVHKIAIGEPKTVPAGHYATELLKKLDLEAAIASRIVYAENVRQVLAYVERGEADAGIVYATDAKISGEKVLIVTAAPGEESFADRVFGDRPEKRSECCGGERISGLSEHTRAQKILSTYGFRSPESVSLSPATAP